jgi:two-component system KDP operon response regulator KdpE
VLPSGVFCLPVANPRDFRPGRVGSTFPQPVIRPARILVVDDNLPLRLMVAQVLEEQGYVTVAAESGEAALEAATHEPPDLCVIDFFMPGMSGAQLLRELRGSPDQRLRAVPVIGLTAYEHGERELLAAGAALVLRKPWNEAAVLAAVNRLLRPPGAPSLALQPNR